MSNEANTCVEILRKAARFGVMDCQYCPAYSVCPTGTAGWNNECLLDTAADLIESLCAELEKVEAVAAEARGLECERDQLKARLEHVEFERDAAVEDLETMGSDRPCCDTCLHEDCGPKEEPCSSCLSGYLINNWQWRGVKMEKEVHDGT